MTRPAPSCFTQDNTRADGFSGHEIYAQMTGGPGTGPAQNAANTAAALERTYAGVEARLKRVGETLGEAWTGASADAAQAAANPIQQATVQMQDSLRQADHSLSNQVYQFNYNKAQLKNMPADKPDTNMWDDVTPWDTDTEDAVNSYNSEESHNRKVYSEFQSASNTNRGELPKEFPGVTADNLNVEITNTGGDDGTDKTSNVSNSSTRPSGTPSGFPTSTGSPQGPGGTWTGPGSITGDQTGTSGLNGGDDRPGTAPAKPGELGIGGKPPVGSVIDRPPTTGIPPIGVPGGPGLSGTGGGRGTSGTSGGAGGGKFGGGGGSGAGGKFGGGGLGGTGTGGSGTAGQQPGGKSGVFGGMGENAQNAGARGGAAGAAGRGGAAGMGGMGGQGQKGQGEDDLEHKSADYLVTEENTNELIGDMPMVAPPTIGG